MLEIKLKKLKELFKQHFKNLIRENLYHYRLSQRSSIEGSPIPSFSDIFKDTNQLGADLTKSINPIILVIFFDILVRFSDIKINRKEIASLDCALDENLIEIKATKALKAKKGIHATTWLGNNCSDKVSKHILISYYLDFELNEITHLFIGYIDLDECETKWSLGTSKKSQFATLKILSKDADKMHIIIGSYQKAKVYTHFHLEKLN